MKKATLVRHTPARKLVAVIGKDGDGLFVREGSGCRLLGSFGINNLNTRTLEEVLAEPSMNRTAVYEGDTVNIQF